jgi:hypothetical protein
VRQLIGAFIFLFLTACANQPCKIEERAGIVVTDADKNKISSAQKDLTQRVFVYKPDGSLQCGMGEKIELEVMKRQLKGIEVFSAENKSDGMMRIQVCGQPTGFCNVYEISKKDLPEALKQGFKQWAKE